MSGLVLRLSEDEGVIRSTGAPPNGIVVLSTSFDRGFWVAVDSKYEPVSDASAVLRLARDREEETEVPVENAVAALVNTAAANRFWGMAIEALVACCATFTAKGHIAPARRALDDLEELQALLMARSFDS